MWIVADYEATTFFTLKPATATASGGKTLLVPTPFAIKMALLDTACRLEGRAIAERDWDGWLSRMRVALRPPKQIVVNNTFIKVLKPRRNPAEPGSRDAGYFQRTITYREYAYLDGTLKIALEVEDTAHIDKLRRWLVNINYLGKRGSFIQITKPPYPADELTNDFIIVDGQINDFAIDAVLTQLDDVGEKLTFSRANIYSSDPIRLGVHRVLKHVALPYRLNASSRSYSHYERMDE
jgi:hypothetical protein